MEYRGISHFNPSVGTSAEDLLVYGDTDDSYTIHQDSFELQNDDYLSSGHQYIDEYPEAEFHETRTIFSDGADRFSATAVTFDQQEELLWIGNQGGYVTSYYGPGLQKHTAFRVHSSQEIRQITSIDDGILVLTQNSLRCQMRRGIPVFTHSSEDMVDMLCLLQVGPDTVLMGGHQGKVIEFNLTECQETGEYMTSASGCAILKQHARYICAGDPAGRVELRAPDSLKIEHVLDAHSGSLSDFDVHGNTLVTCGFSKRQGNLSVDRFLMVYDLRMMRAITPIQLMLDPLLLRFLPSFSSRVAVVSGIGQMQLVDTVALSQQPGLYHIDTGGTMCLSFDVSSSCQCLAFGDGAGTLHLYTSNNHNVLFNTFSQETEFADPVEQLPPISIDDSNTPLSSVPLPFPPHGSSLLSDWPEELVQRAYRKTPPIDAEILRTMKMQGTIGYAPNPYSFRRNHVNKTDHDNNIAKMSSCDTKFNQLIDETTSTSIPRRYRKLVINYSKYGLEDFDFELYNKTSFSGLEALLPNSYCNPMLQVLYFLSPIRKIIYSHLCEKEFCLTCELSFLFYMLDNANGALCQANNFCRTFRSLPDTIELGLSISELNPRTKDTDLSKLIQGWNTFILYQLHYEILEASKTDDFIQIRCMGSSLSSNMVDSASYLPESYCHMTIDYKKTKSFNKPQKKGDAKMCQNGCSETEHERTRLWIDDESDNMWSTLDDQIIAIDAHSKGLTNTERHSALSRMMGIHQIVKRCCDGCHRNSSTETVYLIIQLQYPDKIFGNKELSFCEVLRRSLISDGECMAWCHTCETYQKHKQLHRLKDLPNVLSMNTRFDKDPQASSKIKAFWHAQMDLLVQKVLDHNLRTRVKFCRYGENCTRYGCRFRHPGRRGELENVRPIHPEKSWLPFHMIMHLTTSGNVRIKRYPEGDEGEDLLSDNYDVVKSVLYDLVAVVCYIDDENHEKQNLVALINVAPEYHERSAGSPVSQWYIFNDFSVSPVSAQEVVTFNLDWKIPCLMYWSRSDGCHDFYPPMVNPISVDTLLRGESLVKRTKEVQSFTPLRADELPRKGDIVGIDAEFVTIYQEEAELRSDGKMNTIKPSLLSVARVSCIRGQGPLEGVAFIDDYIRTHEKVVDYLTEYSGICPGDLDANFSQKHLTTLKTTYLKLRYLIDLGVILVGHGLKNDFRVINIIVPPEQVVDTVVLFHLPRHRMISLRFLAWHYLGMKIQAGSHDSIEDARAALLLFKHYKQLEREGKVKRSLRRLYEVGKSLNWKVPGDDDVEGEVDY